MLAWPCRQWKQRAWPGAGGQVKPQVGEHWCESCGSTRLAFAAAPDHALARAIGAHIAVVADPGHSHPAAAVAGWGADRPIAAQPASGEIAVVVVCPDLRAARVELCHRAAVAEGVGTAAGRCRCRAVCAPAGVAVAMAQRASARRRVGAAVRGYPSNRALRDRHAAAAAAAAVYAGGCAGDDAVLGTADCGDGGG